MSIPDQDERVGERRDGPDVPPPGRAGIWSMLLELRKALRRLTNVAVFSLIIAIIGLGVAFQPDQFQRLVAAYYEKSVQVGEPKTSDAFVEKVRSMSDGHWFVKRIWGTRIQFNEVDIDNGHDAACGKPDGGRPPPRCEVREAASDDKAGVLEIPTAECPDGSAGHIRIFVHEATSSDFGTLNASQGRFVLNGLYDVGNVRSRYSKDSSAEYCYVDLFAVR